MKITIAETLSFDFKNCAFIIIFIVIIGAVASWLFFHILSRKINITTQQLKTELSLREKAERQSAAAKEQLNGLVNATNDFVALIDQEGTFIQANQAFADYYKIPLSQLIGTNIFDYCPEDISRQRRLIVERIISTGQPERFEQQENNRYFDCSVFPMKNQNADKPLLALFIRDVTQYQGFMKERERTSRILQDMNAELEGIIRIASHDLKTPLVTINGFAGELAAACRQLVELLSDCDKPNPMKEKIQDIIEKDILVDVDLIKAGTGKIESLVSSLLRLARIGHRKPQTEPIDMTALVNNILKSMAYQIKESNVQIQVDPLPGCLGDEAMINQVMTNLISNAIKYMHTSRPGRIHLRGDIRGDRSVYCIEDNGVGIDSEHQDRIFELFYRKDPEKCEGEGLGLSIVRGIVTRHNGEVWVESVPDRGSLFYISLPKS